MYFVVLSRLKITTSAVRTMVLLLNAADSAMGSRESRIGLRLGPHILHGTCFCFISSQCHQSIMYYERQWFHYSSRFYLDHVVLFNLDDFLSFISRVIESELVDIDLGE